MRELISLSQNDGSNLKLPARELTLVEIINRQKLITLSLERQASVTFNKYFTFECKRNQETELQEYEHMSCMVLFKKANMEFPIFTFAIVEDVNGSPTMTHYFLKIDPMRKVIKWCEKYLPKFEYEIAEAYLALLNDIKNKTNIH
jgi:hypothetical protein